MKRSWNEYDTWLVRLLAAMVLLLGGCTPAFVRQQADHEAYELVARASVDPRWPLDDFHIEPDERSRFFDPFCPDHPPMPPDDPVSHQLMHCVDCKAGYPCWHKWGDTAHVENPDWTHHLPLDETGTLVLDLPSAVHTALIHSTEYQSQIEDLYLSALDVTFERFRFDTQFFGGHSTFFTADGPLRNPASGSSSQLRVAQDLRARRLFTSGGELVVGLANSLVWEFSGPNVHTPRTVIDFTLVQPLLRAGGRIRVMERLTLAERTLLGNIRQMEHFRRGFHIEIVTGRDAGPGPTRRGGFFGGAGLEGFTGIGGGGFGRVGGLGTGGGGLGGAGAAGAGGYLGLLQQQQEIRNLHANVEALRASLERLQVASMAPHLDTPQALRLRFQVELARQALHNAESRLLTAQAQYETQLDAFKVRLGLPPQLRVEVRDTILNPFQLIDTELTALQTRAERLLLNLQPAPQETATVEAGRKEFVAELGRYQQTLGEARNVYGEAVQRLDRVRSAVALMERNAEHRRTMLMQLAARTVVTEQGLAAGVLDVMHFDRTFEAVRQQSRDLENRLTGFGAALDAVESELAAQLQAASAMPPGAPEGANGVDAILARRQAAFALAGSPLTELGNLIAEMWLVLAKARLEAIVVEPIDLDPHDAVEIARVHRLDWMNARASLVDAWRLIHFNANDLKSDLSLVFSGDINNRGANPLKFDSDTGRLRVGVEFDAPLTRLAERNNYRQSLIEYQQAKRSYYRFVDRVSQALQTTIRTIELNQLNLELRRSAVHVALSQVDLAREQLLAPLQPGERSTPGEIGRDLVEALAGLVTVQNDFLSVWLNYRVQQMWLDWDLGTMQLDEHSMWLEPQSWEPEYLLRRPYGGHPPHTQWPDGGMPEPDIEEIPSGLPLLAPPSRP